MKKVTILLVSIFGISLAALPAFAIDNANGSNGNVEQFCKALSQSCHSACDAAALSGKSNPADHISCSGKCADAYLRCMEGTQEQTRGKSPTQGTKKPHPKRIIPPPATQQ